MSTVVALLAAGGSGDLTRPGELVGPAGPPRSSPANIARAELDVHEPDKNGALGPLTTTIELQFNPTSVVVAKESKWTLPTGKGGSTAQYIAWVAGTITFDVFLDATSSPGVGVVEAAEKLQALCLPTAQSKGTDTPSPPLVVLKWGPVTAFPGYVTGVSVTYSLFRADGMPVRASCRLALTEMYSSEERQNPTSGSEAVRRVHQTVAGDTLASIAYAEYGDPGCWRPLAAWNGIDDPLRIRLGTVVQLPSAPELLRPPETVR